MKIGKPGKRTIAFHFFLFTAFWAVFTVVFYLQVSRRTSFVEFRGETLKIADYIYYLLITRGFWFGGYEDVYKLEVQRAILTESLGREVSASMPLNVFPTAFILWIPFAAAALKSVPFAFALWNGFSLAAAAAALLALAGHAGAARCRAAFIPAALCLFSFSSMAALILGQTSLFFAATLVILFLQCRNGAEETGADRWFTTALLIVQSIKPQYFALGAAVALIHRRFAAAAAAAAATAGISALLALRLGLDWPLQYLHTLAYYSGSAVPNSYQESFAPQHMNIFRYAAAPFIGDRPALFLSLIALAAFYCLAVVASSVKSGRAQSPEKRGGHGANRFSRIHALFSPFRVL